MKRRFDIRRYLYVAAIATVLMYVLSTFVFSRAEASFVAVIAGLLLFAFNAAVVYVTVDTFTIGLNHTAPLLFSFLALSFPSVAIYDVSYWCVVPLNAAFYLATRFYMGDVNNDLAFFYNLLLGLTSLLLPPVAWVALFMLLMNLFVAADKGRFVVMSLAGFLLPLLSAMFVVYAGGDNRLLSLAIQGYLDDIAQPELTIGAMSAASVIKILTFVICFAVALSAFFKNSAKYSVSHARAMIMVFAYSVIATLLALLFSYNNHTMSIMIIMVPVSIVIYDYLVWGTSDKQCRIALSFILLAALLEYAFLWIK